MARKGRKGGVVAGGAKDPFFTARRTDKAEGTVRGFVYEKA